MIKATREHPHWAGKKSVEWDRATIESFDLVLIARNHSYVNYRDLAGWAHCIVDTRNAMRLSRAFRVRSGKRRERIRGSRGFTGLCGRGGKVAPTELLSALLLRKFHLAFAKSAQQNCFWLPN